MLGAGLGSSGELRCSVMERRQHPLLQRLRQVQAAGAGTLGQAILSLQNGDQPLVAGPGMARHEIWISKGLVTEPPREDVGTCRAHMHTEACASCSVNRCAHVYLKYVGGDMLCYSMRPGAQQGAWCTQMARQH